MIHSSSVFFEFANSGTMKTKEQIRKIEKGVDKECINGKI